MQTLPSTTLVAIALGSTCSCSELAPFDALCARSPSTHVAAITAAALTVSATSAA